MTISNSDIEIRISTSKYANCLRTIIADDEIWFNASDIQEILGLRNIHTSVSCINANNKRKYKVQTPGGAQMVIHLSLNGFKQLLVKSRKIISNELAYILDIEMNNVIYTCIEVDILKAIQEAFAGHIMITQFHVGNYFIDLYMPEFLLAIECDEDAHRYKLCEDEKKENEISVILPKIKFIRIKPQSKDFNIYLVINQIHQHIMSYSALK